MNPHKRTESRTMIPANEALERLRAGNRKFVADDRDRSATTSARRRGKLVAGQEPFAVIFGCADSRVPAEIVFDQGPGDLFVIRVAGNVVAPSLIGSVEFAVDQFGTPLVVVLGHTDCGAVGVTLKELKQPAEILFPNIQAILDRIRPAVEPLLETELRDDPEGLAREAVRANIRASVDQLRQGSPIIEQRIREKGLLVIGAEYSLETGVVEFFEENT